MLHALEGAVRDRGEPVGRPTQLPHQRRVIGSNFPVALLDRRQRLDDGIGDRALEYAVRLAGELLLDGWPVLVLDRPVDLEEISNASTGRKADRGLRIGLRPSQFLADHVGRIEEEDGVAGRIAGKTLAHLLLGIVETHDARPRGLDHRLGEDQRQHIELTRDVAQRLNQRFGEVFVLPEAMIQAAGARIMGLDDPEKKMSKSLAGDNPGHAIFLLDPPDVIRKKIARAQTDAQPAVQFPAGTGVRNLLEIYRTITDQDWPAVEREFAAKPYSVLKSAVADAVVEALTPIQERYREIRADDAGLMRQLRGTADRLRPIANTTLQRVQHAVGLR